MIFEFLALMPGEAFGLVRYGPVLRVFEIEYHYP